MALQFLSPIHKSTRQLELFLEGRMAKLGVSNPEGHLLSYLASYAPCPVGDLRRVFGYKGSTLTSMLDRLERRGLITRGVHPEDRRSFLVELSEKGLDTARAVTQVVVDLENDIHQHCQPSDLEGFRRVMDAIAAATRVTLSRSPPSGVPRKGSKT